MKFKKGEDVSQRMNGYIDGLFKIAIDMTVEERKDACHELIENYISIMGVVPSSKHLSRMAALLVIDQTVNEKKNKGHDNDYPVLTKRQLRRRRANEVAYIEKDAGKRTHVN